MQNFVLKLHNIRLHLARIRLLRFIIRTPRSNTLHPTNSRSPYIVIPTLQCTLPIDFLAVEGNGVDPMALHIGRSDGKIAAHPSLAEHLLESLLQLAVETELVEESLSILRVGRRWVLGFEPIERHESHTPGLFFKHDVEDFGGGFVGVDNDMEETK